MKTIILILLLTMSPFISAKNTNQDQSISLCKEVGDKAKEIMIKRQQDKDLFEVLASYQEQASKDMVLEAYDEPYHDILSQLRTAINSAGKASAPDESRKYDEIIALRNNAIRGFRNRYIKLCLQSK